MSKNENVLVVGASVFQIPLIKRLSQRGFTSYAVSNIDGDPGLSAADKGFDISILDYEALQKLCDKEGISCAVTCASDLATVSVARLNRHLGANGVTPEQIDNVTDKGNFCLLQEKLSLPHLNFWQISAENDLKHVIDGIDPFPVLMKPFFSSGTRGVVIAHNKNDILKNNEHVWSSSYMRKGYVIQQFLADGIEAGCECFIEDGEVRFLELTNKFLNDNMVPIGHCAPSRFPRIINDAVTSQVNKIAQELGIMNSPVNIDVFIRENSEPIIVDFSLRLGGNLLPDIMHLKYGIEPYDKVINYTLGGNFLRGFSIKESPGNIGAIIFGGRNDGILTADMIDRLKTIFHDIPEMFDLAFDIKAGESYSKFNQGNKRFGHSLFRVNNLDDYRSILDSVQKIL